MKISFVYVGTDLSGKFKMNELISHESNKDATGRAPCYIQHATALSIQSKVTVINHNMLTKSKHDDTLEEECTLPIFVAMYSSMPRNAKNGDEKPAWKKQFCAPYQEKLFTGYTVALTRKGLGNLPENIRHQHVLVNSSVLRL